MKRIQLITCIALAMVLFYGCAGTPSSGYSTGSKRSMLEGQVWFLAGYQRESGFVPIEPGHGSTARIVFRKDGTFEATSGWSVFSGKWNTQNTLSSSTSSAKFYPAAFKSSAPSTVAEQFEQDLIRALKNTRSIMKGAATVRFLDASGKPLLDLISSNPGR